MGPTASGKTALAEAVAERRNAWLINADAFQVYRGMDIGTAKPPDRSRYHLLDIKNPNETFSCGEWVERAGAVLRSAWDASRDVVIVGGSGLYIRSLFENYTEMASPPPPGLREELTARLANEGLEALVAELRERSPTEWERTDLQNPQRVTRALERAQSAKSVLRSLPPFQRTKFAIPTEPAALAARIEQRVRDMVDDGWLDEIQALLGQGYRQDDPGFRAHGYRPMASVLSGELALLEAILRTTIQVRQYAKRQRTWLRREPGLRWLQGCMIEAWVETIEESSI